MREIRLATRGSLLAMAQAEDIKKRIEALGYPVVIHKVETKGDRDRIHALQEIGGDGLFVRAIEQELLEDRADVAVHCGKDLPYRLHEDLMIAAVPEAADPRDVLLWPEGKDLSALRVVGTGSPRRCAQLKKLLPGAEFAQIRGNINTRIEKLRSGAYDGIVLAQAGLDRLKAETKGLQRKIFSTEEMLPAPCQGILALECRRGEAEILTLLSRLNHPLTWQRFQAERQVFCALKADCSLPVGVFAWPLGAEISIRAMFDGRYEAVQGQMEQLPELARMLRAKLLAELTMQAGQDTQTNQDTKPGQITQVGQVTLVGAGCGAGLITVLGQQAVESAEVLVYDDLIDPGVTALAGADCERIYVGKRYQVHSRTQEEINRILIEKAKEGKQVVRLKGGDSFVFGRGGEECLALRQAGISYRVIPGISSSIAVPECAGIPVTHRKLARSFTVITGHTADGTGENYAALAGLEGTLIFLMGKHAYPEITRRLIEEGKDPKTPAAVLSNGCSSRQLRIDAQLETIARAASHAPTPAILVVGNTAGMHLGEMSGLFPSFEVTVTGSAQFSEKMGNLLRKVGARVKSCPTLEIVSRTDRIPKELDEYSWLAFTSANGIRIFFDWMRERGRDLRDLAGHKFACIGRGTADALWSYGIRADYIPEKYTAGELGIGLGRIVGEKEKILILRAENGSPLLTEALSGAGRDFLDCKIYDTKPAFGEGAFSSSNPVQGMEETSAGRSYLVFASAGGVKSWLNSRPIPEGSIPVCIGEYTAQALQESFAGEILVAEDYTADGILAAIRKNLLSAPRGG